MTSQEQLLKIQSILGKKKSPRRKVKSVRKPSGTRNRRSDEELLKSKFVGTKVEGWKFDFNYSVTITPTGFKTRSGEEFDLLQVAVNHDILNNGLPESFLPGVTVWTQGCVGNNKLDEVL